MPQKEDMEIPLPDTLPNNLLYDIKFYFEV